MANGTLGIIGCPILEDEIIYSIYTDKEEKRIYLIDTPPAHTLREKLRLKGIPFELIDEWEFSNGYSDAMMKSGFNVVILMNKLGLHSQPAVLRQFLEDQLRQYHARFDSIALYYGMCGNAGWDVSEWASKTLGSRVFVFRDKNNDVCDDCIGVAVGGHSRYCDFVRKYAGMFFVTPAIAENWTEFSKELDMCKGFEIMDIFTVKEVFEVYGYKNAVKIDTGIGITGEDFDRGCLSLSEETGLELITAEPGSADLYPLERIYRDAKGALNQGS
ncbi:MAG: DUF1638 domain-containing protein [Candidatus Methanoplasma sp.]|jgi:hypothetical protein|nr:DUF1638 domain-containing protein [Candidatus Methanoplasma sp.]